MKKIHVLDNSDTIEMQYTLSIDGETLEIQVNLIRFNDGRKADYKVEPTHFSSEKASNYWGEKWEEISDEIKEHYLNPHGDGWMQWLQPLIDEYKDGDDEALDGDEVDKLMIIIKAKINFNEGNLSLDEYNKILG